MNRNLLRYALLGALIWLSASSGSAQQTATTTPASRPTTRRVVSPNIRPTVEPIARPVAAIKRVLVISIDGLRPDLLLRGETPHLKKLMADGCFSMWARTTPNSITLPSHMSMLTGVNPRRHDVEWNREFETIEPVWPRVPTLFEAAKRHGYTTAVVSGKAKFSMFDRPGVLDWSDIPDTKTLDDGTVLKNALKVIREHRPQVMLIHLPTVDSWGHTSGWSSADQMKAIGEADWCIGEILAALDEVNVRGETLIIISADHGGHGKGHGPEDARSRHIPWIASGPGLRQGYDLSINPKLQINTEDTFATACWALGIRPTVLDLDGAPVKLIVEPPDKELLQNTSPRTPTSW